MSELEIIESVTSSYTPWVQKLFVSSNINAIQNALSVLDKLEAIEVQHHNPQKWFIRTGYMHVAVTLEKTTGMEGRTQ